MIANVAHVETPYALPKNLCPDLNSLPLPSAFFQPFPNGLFIKTFLLIQTSHSFALPSPLEEFECCQIVTHHVALLRQRITQVMSECKKGRSHNAVGYNLGRVCSKKEEQDPRHQDNFLALLTHQLTRFSMTNK